MSWHLKIFIIFVFFYCSKDASFADYANCEKSELNAACGTYDNPGTCQKLIGTGERFDTETYYCKREESAGKANLGDE